MRCTSQSVSIFLTEIRFKCTQLSTGRNIDTAVTSTTFEYNPFHKTLPRFCLQMHLISGRFYEMSDRLLDAVLKSEKK